MSAKPANVTREQIVKAALRPAVDATAGFGEALQIEGEVNGVAFRFIAWPAGQLPPPATPLVKPRKDCAARRWGDIKLSITSALRSADKPLNRARMIKALREAKTPCAVSTLARVLSEMIKEKSLVNLNDKKGYRLPEWPLVLKEMKNDRTPSLFD